MSFYQDYLKKESEEKESSGSLKEKEEDNSEYPQHFVDKNSEEKVDPRSKEEIEREKFLKKVYGRNNDSPSLNLMKEESFSQENVTPPVPTAPPKSQKIWVRIAITFLIIAIAASLSAFFWRWAIKTPRIITETITKEIETIIEIPEIEAPYSFLKYDKFLEPTITRTDEIPVYLKQYVDSEYDKNDLVKISIKNQVDRIAPHFITLRTFFSALKIDSPTNFYDKVIHENFNLFLYAGEQNDLGFLFPTKEGELTELMGIVLAIWDDKFEKDFENFYTLAPAKETITPPSNVYRGANIRCKDFGNGKHLCYTPYRNIFLFTTSLESAKAVIDNLR